VVPDMLIYPERGHPVHHRKTSTPSPDRRANHRHALTTPSIVMSPETYVYSGFMRFARVATYADRQETMQILLYGFDPLRYQPLDTGS
jgi:hypothetical protein